MVEAMIEAQDTINPEVGEDLLLGEGEDPQIETRSTESGMRSRLLGQDLGLGPIRISKDGRKAPGKNMKMNMPQDIVETTIETIETKNSQ